MSTASEDDFGGGWRDQDAPAGFGGYGRRFALVDPQPEAGVEPSAEPIEPAYEERREALGWRALADTGRSGEYGAPRSDPSARALLGAARDQIDRAIAAATAEAGRTEADRVRLEQRAGESERLRAEAVREQEALEMVLRRTEERLIASERDSQAKDDEVAELHRRVAAAEARTAEAEKNAEDIEAASALRIEEFEAQSDARVEAARSEAAQAIEDARAEAAAEIERSKEDASNDQAALRTALESAEGRTEALEVAAEAAEQAAEAAAANGAALREEADKLRKRVEDRVKELEKELADSQTEIRALKEWRAKTIERLRSAGLLKGGHAAG